MSLEVAEHIPTAHEHAYLANLNCSVGLGLVLSWAPPGQLGAGHVNLREQHDVVARLAAFGLVVDVGVSALLAAYARVRWLRNNVMVFVRPGRRMELHHTARALLDGAQIKRVARGTCGTTRTLPNASAACARLSASSRRVMSTAIEMHHSRALADPTTCVRQCELCESCAYVSTSARYDDCSWYTRCDLDAIEQRYTEGAGLVYARHRAAIAATFVTIQVASKAASAGRSLSDACKLIPWPSHRPALRYCTSPGRAGTLDWSLNWILKRADSGQKWAIGKLSRTAVASLLRALRPSGARAPCDVACLWPTLSCVLKESRSQQQQDLSLLPRLLAITNQQPGTFLEIGAFNGVEMSNTHMLEKCFGWRGLLIEANPVNFAALNASGRVSTKVHSAVCHANTPGGTVQMTVGGWVKPGALVTSKVVSGSPPKTVAAGRAGGGDHGGKHTGASELKTVAVPCAPLRRLMHDAGLHQIDFLSLDVEGGELDVLSTVSPASFRLVMVEEELMVSTRETIRGVQAMLVASGFVSARIRVPYNSVWERSASGSGST